jgi:hypothetical protein
VWQGCHHHVQHRAVALLELLHVLLSVQVLHVAAGDDESLQLLADGAAEVALCVAPVQLEDLAVVGVRGSDY